MFVGTFEHSLDDKGRVVLPSTFRSHLAARGFLSKLDGCLGLWTPEEFEKVAELIRDRVREGRVAPDALRVFAADAAEVKPDSQGRISIPQRLRDFAGLERELIVNGRLDRIEIWDVDRWNRVADTADQNLAAAVVDLGI
ncbi:MAG TPA: division/cell wall cluster transcriptional repressor MraZ [Acidimicrobiales bacterium]|nr:division/cell wall cluster transcriptional repressor MraZ [Acidimicrobiales bacterium]